MINRDRILKLLRELKELEADIKECLDAIDASENEKMKKLLYHSIRAYFLDFHILCEDYISINLKTLNKFKIDISAIEGMEIIKNSDCISDEFFDFYTNSRRLRNRLAHRYKMPKDEDICESLRNNLFYINDLEESLRKYI